MADAAAQYRARVNNLRGTFRDAETPEVEEFVEVAPTGQAEVVETQVETEEED